MIPKKIHYCWFGGKELPELAVNCIESWKKYCPEYEIIRWDETTFDIESYPYVKEAYDAKKWAFITDVVRLYALVEYGGIYMDTDVEVLKPLDELLECNAFSGFEDDYRIPTGIMASEKGHSLFVELLDEYENIHFIKEDGTYDLTTNVERITKTCLEYGLVQNNQKQTVNGFTLFPKDYLCAKDPATKEICVTNNTYTIHHFDGSWLNRKQKFILHNKVKFKRFFSDKTARKITVLLFYFLHPISCARYIIKGKDDE